MESQAFEFMILSDIYRNIAWAIGPTVLAAIILVGLRLRKWLLNQDPDPSDGVQKTRLARLDGGLPLDLSLIAGAGRNAQAPRTFQDTYLRPTIGLRFMMFGFPVVLYLILQSLQTTQGYDLASDRITQVFAATMLVIMLHNIVYFNSYELRYDDARIVHRTWFYQRIELPISRLLSIRDDGMYFYIIRTDAGKKAYVPKHLIGIEDFVRYVRAEIAKNESY